MVGVHHGWGFYHVLPSWGTHLPPAPVHLILLVILLKSLRQNTWAHGQKVSRSFPVPLHLNELDLGDSPRARELAASTQAGAAGEHSTPCL